MNRVQSGNPGWQTPYSGPAAEPGPTIFAVIRTIDREERLLAAADGEATSAASKTMTGVR
jgi:hypothetical protein